MEYQISTIKDIFDKVPSDKVDTCLNELKILIHQAHIVKIVHDEAGAVFEFPNTTTWIDDGKGDVTTDLIDRDSKEFLGSIKCKLTPPS